MSRASARPRFARRSNRTSDAISRSDRNRGPWAGGKASAVVTAQRSARGTGPRTRIAVKRSAIDATMPRRSTRVPPRSKKTKMLRVWICPLPPGLRRRFRSGRVFICHSLSLRGHNGHMAALPSWLIVSLIEILKAAPLASATAWFVLAILQVYRDRWHTWTEAFFLFCCFFAGLYAIGDFLLFYSTTYVAALFSTLVSLTGLTLAVNFFLLFTLVYVDRMRRSYGLLMAISIVMLLLVFRFGITMINAPTADAPLFFPVFDFAILGIHLAYILADSIVGIPDLYRLYQIV